MSKISTKELSFSSIKTNFDDAMYAIPQLQRNYVWDKNRVCLLLDSIYNHYPIGVSLIWKAKSSKISEIKSNTKTILPSFNYNRKTIDFIIDGQQRLTSLYGLYKGVDQNLDDNSKFDFKKIYLCLDPKSDKRFVFLARYDESRGDHVPVHHIINDPTERLRRNFNLSQADLRLVNKFKTQLKSYRFHFIYVTTDSIEEVRETFVRINSQGMTVGKADALFARTTNIGLRDLVNETKAALKGRGYQEMKPENFIYTMLLSKGENELGKRAIDNFTKKFSKQKELKSSFQKEWKKYHKGFALAADYLAEQFGVGHLSELPSGNIFTMLAFFFIQNNGRADARQKQEIRKWFWHTAIGERYSGNSFGKNIPRDVRFFRKLANGMAKYTVETKIHPMDFLKLPYNKSNFSAVKGYYLFLKFKKPKYLTVGYQMQMDRTISNANRKDRHHIFPTAVLNRKKIKGRWNNSLVNICYLAADENQSISDDYPRVYLGACKRKKYFAGVMKSHLIPFRSSSGIWNSNTKEGFKSFINDRSALLLNEISKVAGLRRSELFERYELVARI